MRLDLIDFNIDLLHNIYFSYLNTCTSLIILLNKAWSCFFLKGRSGFLCSPSILQRVKSLKKLYAPKYTKESTNLLKF